MPSVVPSGSPIAIAIGGFVGIVGAGVAAAYQSFRIANVKAEQARLNLAMKSCDERADRLEREIRELESRLREAEKRESVWQTRYEILIAKSQTINTSSLPPKKETE